MSESTKIFTFVKELGHANSKREELREYCKLKIDQIIKFLPRRILNSDGGEILDCIFNGIPEDSQSLNRSKVKIVDIVLFAMRTESTSLTHCSDVISRLCLELPRMPVEDLLRLSNDTVQSIVDDNDVNMIWKDVLPECLSSIATHGEVVHCGTAMSPAEFKEQCVRTLCQCRWAERQLVPLAAMFKDMQLNRENHKQVVNKICSYVRDVPPDTLPPLLHQLLKLCNLYDVEVVLASLSNYFSVRLYSKLEPPPQDSESTTMDIDDIVQYSSADLSRCLSTCLYHVAQGAADPELIRRHLAKWPRSQLLHRPFLLDVALALADKGTDFRTICLDVIRQAIEQRLEDEETSRESAWARAVLPPGVDVASVLKVLTTESAAHRQLTTLGLINLAFTLLARKAGARAACALGELVLVRLAKSQPETAPHILGRLADRLAGDVTAQAQYASCLYHLCKLCPLSVERCSQLGAILEGCQPSGGTYRAAARVLHAARALLGSSTRLRDALLLRCRKGLYERDSAHRCLALSGFLTVLRHVKLPRALASSQSACSEQYSGQSYLTQLTVDLHATQQGRPVTSRVRNEAVCMEVVSILRRCLLQDAAVKQLLYSKIYECTCEKPVLHEAILEILYEHLTLYQPEDDAGPPLAFDKCVQVSALNAVLTEPIGHLLFAVAQFLAPQDEDLEDILSSQSGETGSAYLKSKLASILQQLCTGSLANIDMEDPGLSDLTPESKAKSHKVQQVLQCYEALIAHQVLQWTAASDRAATAVHDLFKTYNSWLEKTKSPPKLGKKTSKTGLNDTRETNRTQKSQRSQKDKGKTPAKLAGAVKDRAGPFKPLPCLWDLSFCVRALELLYSEEVPWSSLDQRNQIRARRDFHHFVLRCAQSVLADEDLDKGAVAHYVVKMAALLYHRFLCRFQDMCDFDDQTALSCLDLFKDCLTLLYNPTYGFKIELILPNVTGTTEGDASEAAAAILNRVTAALEQSEAEAEAEATPCRRTATALFAVATICARAADNTAIVKLEDFVRRAKQDCVALLPPILAANCRDHQDSQFLDDLLVKLASALGRIDEEDTSAEQRSEGFPFIDAATGQAAHAHVCAHLMLRARHAARLVARARELQRAPETVARPRELKELNKSLVIQLCQLTTWTSRVCKLRCAVGAGSDRALACCVRLYSLLGAFVKQLEPSALQELRVERLLKLSGKKLSAITDNLITYLEASQPQQQTASKVLRDTKQIPRLVLEAEQFSKHVIVLSNRAKMNFQQYLSLGTARDFRIKGPVLQEMLNARDQQERIDDTSEELEMADGIHDADTTILSDKNENDDQEKARIKRRRVM